MPRKKRALLETEFSDEQLDEFQQILTAERNKLVQHLRNSSQNLVQNRQAGEESADIGSDEFSRETSLSMLDGGNCRLKMINGALRRILDKTYGICEDCGQMISEARLNAKPQAKYCIRCKNLREERGEETY
ncbi:MAG: TraR/DksA family transcriptional regulator [Lentisphaeria bacterium]